MDNPRPLGVFALDTSDRRCGGLELVGTGVSLRAGGLACGVLGELGRSIDEGAGVPVRGRLAFLDFGDGGRSNGEVSILGRLALLAVGATGSLNAEV